MRVSIVIPTYNERDNIARLLSQLQQSLAALAGEYEIIVVDDASPDGTADVVRQWMRDDTAVQLLSRTGQRDLSTAIAAGFGVARGDCLLAMDADLQHDPSAVLPMLSLVRAGGVDLVVATRYAAGGVTVGWPWWRRTVSRLATMLARWRLPQDCSDPLSGFFLLRREAWQRISRQLQPGGFKLLFDILLAAPDLSVSETGFRFAARRQGASKFGAKVLWSFLCSLLRSRQ